MSNYIGRRSEEHRGLEALGWRRVRRSRRRIQPEVWKRKKIWHEAAGRELVVRIVRHNGLFRAELVRVRHGEVWWQPLRDMDMECPLALATVLHFDGHGDPVRAAYVEAKPYADDVLDWPNWVKGHPGQMPRVTWPEWALTAEYDHMTDAKAYALRAQYRQKYDPNQDMRNALERSKEHRLLEVDFSAIEERVAATLNAKDRSYPWIN